ncbi:MAG: pyridoxal phosphate-dependent aminotransferase [Planctomycetota bacterium]
MGRRRGRQARLRQRPLPTGPTSARASPRSGRCAGAPRIDGVEILPEDHAYGPLEGIPELRRRVAEHYNRLFRQGKASQYGPENVAIAMGGRLALTRAFAALGEVRCAYQVPDYTAYEDLFNYHLDRVEPILLEALPEEGFLVRAARVRDAVERFGARAYVLSNPCNPTGQMLEGQELADLVALSREAGLTLLLDEFYSHFVYTADGRPGDGPVSAAPYVEDVEEDPVLLFDGLTKSYRYPGWRIGWVVGPSWMVEPLARTASALDGGPSRIAQRAALRALEPAQADAETEALRDVFAEKCRIMVERLEGMGMRFAHRPRSTFYCWASIADLPAPFDDPFQFFWKALDRKVMTVPGEFFDVNPGKRRKGPSPYRQWMRFSFGPPLDNMQMGLDRLEEMLG